MIVKALLGMVVQSECVIYLHLFSEDFVALLTHKYENMRNENMKESMFR